MPVWVASTDAPVCMRERGGWDGECTGSEATSLLSYTLRYVSLAELGTLPVWVASTDASIIRNCKDSHLSWKKNLPSVFEHLTRQFGILSARRSTTRAWGCMQHDCLCTRFGLHLVPTHSYVNSWPSCLLQCRTYLVPVKLRSTW